MALGLLLSRQGIRPTIYERREKPTAEELAKPSGMLDLHEESGLRVMRECDLWDAFEAATGDCSQETRVIDRDGTVVHTDQGDLEFRPEIPRNSLTTLLSENVPEEIIRYNHKINAVRSEQNAITGATEIILDLGEKGTATYDFVVGADGAWSRVRKLLSDTKPFYGGIQFLTTTARHVSVNHPDLLELNGSGTLMCLGGGNGLMTHRGPQDSIRLYTAVSTAHENWAELVGVKGKTAAQTKETLLRDDGLFGKWAPQLQDLLAKTCDEETKDNAGCVADITPLYMFPLGHRWEHQIGATLVGDAAHLMLPFAGEGVNLALWDTLDLARALTAGSEATNAASWQKSLEPAMREFEETMMARAQEKAEETLQNRNMMFGENGARYLAQLFTPPGDMPPVDGPHDGQ